jgi:hypothetical protein
MTSVTETGTGTADRTQAAGAPGTCRYPGCASPARDKDPAVAGHRARTSRQVVAPSPGGRVGRGGPHTPPKEKKQT